MLGCWALISGAVVQLSSANTEQTIWKVFAWYRGELWPDSPTFVRLYVSQCLTLTNKAPTY